MGTNFCISFTNHNGKLHVSPRGIFDGNSAWELINLLDEAYTDERQVIIDTEGLKEVFPLGCTTFQVMFDLSGVPKDRLIFTGPNGSAIAPEGCRILTSGEQAPCRCRGNGGDCHGRSRQKIH